MTSALAVFIVVCLAVVCAADMDDKEYTNLWVAEIHGGEPVAKRVARDLGYTYGGEAVFDNHYLFTRDDHPEISKRSSHHLTKDLEDLEEVKWAQQQRIMKRVKRGIIPEPRMEEPHTRATDAAFLNLLSSLQGSKFGSSKYGSNKYGSGYGSSFGSAYGSGSLGSGSFGSGSFGSGSLGSGSYGSPFSFSSSTFSKPSSFYKPGSSSSSYFSSYPSSSSSNPSSSSSFYSSYPGSSSSKPGSSSSFYSSYPSTSSSNPSYYSPFAGSTSQSGSQASTSLGKFSTKPLTGNLDSYDGVTQHIGCVSTKTSAYESMFNDPLWTKQWYFQDYRTKEAPVMDHNIVPVYKMGYTGKSVTVAVVDDGLQPHPDLSGNYIKSLSYDMCNDMPGSEPDPSSGHPNSHGTKCAGEIAMVANNNKCGVGVAYNAKVAGVKILGNRAMEYGESRGLVWKLDTFDIYSNSWGPSDDGMTMEKEGRLTEQSFEKGISEGRNGKGAVYVFAGGNGRHNTDNCAADGMVNNPHIIAISSVSQNGKTAYYSERCTAIFAGAYSGGNARDEKVATIDLDGGCTTTFSGTSAAAPIATGIITLTLDANPNLTYRDVMHLIAMSSEVAPLADNGDIWYKNGKGFWVSNDFGFGLLNAENMVTLAKSWTNVPEKNTCIVSVSLEDPDYLAAGEVASITFDTDACQDTTDDAVYFLEVVEVACTVQYPYRGALSINLTSPAGTETALLETRPKDSNRDGLREWSIKTVHNWGEDPKGSWTIAVKANALPGVRASSGYVQEFTMTFHGTAKKPAYHDTLPRKYAGFRLPNGQTSEV